MTPHPLAALADKAIAALRVQLERAEVEGNAIEVGRILEWIEYYELQKVEVERR